MNWRSLKVLITFLACCMTPNIAIGQNHSSRQYTEEHPLVYEDAWDLWPYVFLNEHGEPEGFNIDLLKELFHELDIPYVIRLKPTKEALEDIRTGQSDLMLRLQASFHDDYATYGKEAVQLFTHSVVSPKSKPLSIHSLKDLGTNKVIVHTGSLSHRMMADSGWDSTCIPYDDMKEAIQKVSTEDEGQIVWNTQSLKWLMKKFQVQNLQMTPLDMPHGEYKFMSNDTVLLHKLDSAYSYLCSTERIQPILNKWFYPERIDSGIPEWVAYAAAVAGLLVFLLLYYVIVLHIRERKMTRLIARHNKRLVMVLRTTKVKVWLYDVQHGTVRWMNDDGELDTSEQSLEAFSQAYTSDTFLQLKDALGLMTKGEKPADALTLRSDDRHGSREYMVNLSVFRQSKKGTPKAIVGMMDDQTEQLRTQREAKDNMLRYQYIFSTSMVDMIYYNTDGVLTDINQKACETFHCNREEILAEGVPFNYAIEDNSISVEDFEGCHSTHIIRTENRDNLAKTIFFRQSLYYEQLLIPVHDDTGRFLGIFASGRDVDEFVQSYHQLKRSIRQLTSAATDITEYMNNINYALHVGGVRIVNYSPGTHLLTIYREMNDVQLTLTQTRCLSLLDDKSKRAAMRLFNNMDSGSGDSMEVDVCTVLRTTGTQRLALQFHFVPVCNEQGKAENYFGLCRDVSQVKNTEDELMRERAKAQEVENVKNVFLRNMSREIRTPITTVVNFAKQLSEDHAPADEEGFISEIKTNAAYLLKLVNDILFLSRLDARMIEFNKMPIDFSFTFEGHCQMGWSHSQKDGVEYVVVSPYEHLIIEIDDANVGKIIEQVAENAARFTDNGSVRARYDYIGDKLLITIEDTGCGIEAEKQASLFARFGGSGDGEGTGLGMAICKELVQQMGGSIHINSAAGRGTTIWIVIPCKATYVEKKLLSN